MSQTKSMKRMNVDYPDVVVLGVDTGHKIGTHELVGERETGLNPDKPNMALVNSFRLIGFDPSKPIKLRKEKVSYVDDEGNDVEKVTHVVVDGRNRVLAARFFNRDLPEAERLEPYVIVDGASEDDGDRMVILNSARSQDSTMIRARRADRLKTINGKTVEQIAAIESVDVATVRRWIKLTTMPKATQKAVDGGKISANVALKVLGKLKDEGEKTEHSDALQKLLDDHAQTKMAPSIKRAEHIVGGGTTAEAPKNSAKPKVGGRHIKLMAQYAESGDIELPEGISELISALTDPEYSPKGTLKAIMDRIEGLEDDRKAAEKTVRDAENKVKADGRKTEKDAEREKAKATKDKEKAAAKAVKLKDKADKAQLAVDAANAALKEAANAADLDPATLGIDVDGTAEGELSL